MAKMRMGRRGQTHPLAGHAIAHVLQGREEDLDWRVRQLGSSRLRDVQPRLRRLAASGAVEFVHPLRAVRANR